MAGPLDAGKVKYEIEVALQTDEQPEKGDKELRALVFQSIRELLFNVAKHANVKHATITLCCRENTLSARVRDEGMGFDPRLLEVEQGGTGAGFGLRAIRERLAAVGGRMQIESAPGHGTTTTILVPLH